jgi:hypothetical protein
MLVRRGMLRNMRPQKKKIAACTIVGNTSYANPRTMLCNIAYGRSLLQMRYASSVSGPCS